MNDFLTLLTKAWAIITSGDVSSVFYFNQVALLVVHHVPKLALYALEWVWCLTVLLMYFCYLLKFAECVAIQILDKWFRLLEFLHNLVASRHFNSGLQIKCERRTERLGRNYFDAAEATYIFSLDEHFYILYWVSKLLHCRVENWHLLYYFQILTWKLGFRAGNLHCLLQHLKLFQRNLRVEKAIRFLFSVSFGSLVVGSSLLFLRLRSFRGKVKIFRGFLFQFVAKSNCPMIGCFAGFLCFVFQLPVSVLVILFLLSSHQLG